MQTYRLRPQHRTVAAQQLTAEDAAYAVAYANALPREQRQMEPPSLPPGVSYHVMGGFVLDVSGRPRLAIGDYVVQDHGGYRYRMSAEDFTAKYEPDADVVVPEPSMAFADRINNEVDTTVRGLTRALANEARQAEHEYTAVVTATGEPGHFERIDAGDGSTDLVHVIEPPTEPARPRSRGRRRNTEDA